MWVSSIPPIRFARPYGGGASVECWKGRVDLAGRLAPHNASPDPFFPMPPWQAQCRWKRHCNPRTARCGNGATVNNQSLHTGSALRRASRWLVGAALFYPIAIGAIYGLVADRTPWWSWVCIAIFGYQILRAVPARIRNGYWGYNPSASAWEQMKAEERLKR